MRKAVLVALVSVLVGACTSAAPCPSPHFDVVNSSTLSDGAITQNIEIARWYLLNSGAMGEGELNAAMCGTKLRIRANREWDTVWGDISGFYDVLGNVITVGADMELLVHEMMHQKDGGLEPGTLWHESWDRNGHYALAQMYGWTVTGVPPRQWKGTLPSKMRETLLQAGVAEFAMPP